MLCPDCASPRVYPSRPRNAFERLRQAFSSKEPHRCHACGWRQWVRAGQDAAGPEVRPDDLRTGRAVKPMSPTDLDRLDPR